MNKKFKSVLMAASMVVASATYGFGQAAPTVLSDAQPTIVTTDAWSFGGAIYGWIAQIDGETSSGDKITVSFSDIIDNLKMTFMGVLTAQKGKFTVFSDLIYLKLGTTNNMTANIIGHPAKVKAKVRIKNWINTTGVAYSIFDNGKTELSGLGGVRYLKLKASLDLDVGPISRKVTDSGDFFDGVIGIRGKTELSDKWYMTYYADIGTGQSDLTYQLFAGVNYRFNKWDAVVGYRYMNWDLGNKGLVSDLTVKGPMVGARFRF